MASSKRGVSKHPGRSALLLVTLAFALPVGLRGSPGEARPLGMDDRIACQAALDSLARRQRAQAAGLAHVPDAGVAAVQAGVRRAEDSVRLSRALQRLWGRAIRPAHLQQEIDRMVRDSRDPNRLGEIFATLDDDPGLVAECVARPALASRLARNWYANDPRFHAATRARAEAGIRALGGLAEITDITSLQAQARASQVLTEPVEPQAVGAPENRLSNLVEEPGRFLAHWHGMRSAGIPVRLTLTWEKQSFEDWWTETRDQFAVDEPRSPLTEPSAEFSLSPLTSTCDADTWSPTANDLPDPRDYPTAVWTGAEMIVWGGQSGSVLLDSGGRYDPATDTWSLMTLAGAPTPRYLHTAVWTDSRMIVWGGYGYSGAVRSGASYDPATDSWTAIEETLQTPSARGEHVAVWTGSEMIVWGGAGSELLTSGGRYNPMTDTWVSLPEAGLAPRYLATAVWTGTEMIVWGGGNHPALFNNGARYNPALNQWTNLPAGNAPSGRQEHTAVWTGTSMVVWGGYGGGAGGPGTFLGTGARFTPGTGLWTPVSNVSAPPGRWSHTAVWTGSRMVVWGGLISAGVRTNGGARYDPGTNSWSATPSAMAPQSRMRHAAVWSGTEMMVWGGNDYPLDGFIYLQSGGRYDPVSHSWVPMAAGASVAEARRYHSTIWTGVEMIVWGGQGSEMLRSGGRYDPAVDDWSSTSLDQAPSARRFPSAVWTGSEMIVWGGETQSMPLASGGRYDPSLDQWVATSTVDAPAARARHSAVWTGQEMVVAGVADDVGRYDPLADTWVTTAPPSEIVARRSGHLALWTGSEMLLWGGGASDLDAYGNFVSLDTSSGGRFDPRHDSWERLYPNNAPPPTTDGAGVWTGTEMIVWGGAAASGLTAVGGRFDPLADTWVPLPLGPDAPSKRRFHSAVWTGADMIVWGGEGAGSQVLADGARFDPSADAWFPMSGLGAPQRRSRHGAVFTGQPAERMTVWGGLPNASSGGSYCAPCTETIWYADGDGDGRGDGGIALSACTQPAGHSPIGDDCDDIDADRAPGLAELCADGKDNDCNGTVDDALPPGSISDLFVVIGAGGEMTFEWSHAAGADAFDLTRGSLTALHAAGGNFAAAGSACIANDTTARTAADADPPPAGEIYFYLPRGVNCVSGGTYDSNEPTQVGTRAALDGAPGACP